MNECSHCSNFSRTWDKFIQSYVGNVVFNKIDVIDANEDLAKYDIVGFPTVVIIDHDDKFEHFYNLAFFPVLCQQLRLLVG